MRNSQNYNTDKDEQSLDQGSEFTAPLGKLENARLIFASVADRLRLTDDAAPPALLQAYFGRGKQPRIWLQDNLVTVKYALLPFLVPDWRRTSTAIRLNSTVRWEIELRGGVSGLDANLVQLPLDSLDILGGASSIHLRLSRPLATSYIYIAGSVSRSGFYMPPETGLRVQISGSASRLQFDGREYKSIEGETRLQSNGYDSASSRYDICIAGGASDLTITRFE